MQEQNEITLATDGNKKILKECREQGNKVAKI